MKQQECIDAYLKHMRVRNFSPETVAGHDLRLKKWAAFCRQQKIEDVEEVTPKTIRQFQAWLFEYTDPATGHKLQPQTQNNNAEAVARLFRFAWEEGFVPENPAKRIEYAKEPKRLPRTVLTTTEMRRLLNCPETDRLVGYRDRTILEVLYGTMIRRGELQRLKVEDVNFEDKVLRVNAGKGNKDRVVPLGKMAARYLKHYLKDIRPHFIQGKDLGFLFLSTRGRELSRSMTWFIVRKYAESLGLGKKVYPHCFRATGLTQMMRNGANIRHLMEIAGHASLESLNSYLAVEVNELKETLARTHPRELDLEGDRQGQRV